MYVYILIIKIILYHFRLYYFRCKDRERIFMFYRSSKIQVMKSDEYFHIELLLKNILLNIYLSYILYEMTE